MPTPVVRADKSTQMNIRIGASLKAAGDAIFARCGMSPSEAVRRLYKEVVQTGEWPFGGAEPEGRVAPAHESAAGISGGLAVAMYEQITGMSLAHLADCGDVCGDVSDAALRDEVYDEQLGLSGE
ncbi:MAG: type II toxin-antitoxin system RelB/DinJ family antitoxin [Atopobiaceae bacterium]|nr:type II toxin-antitoxin system RelB/DinJ family antitoxin [Atopobiaceae bacterium]